MKKILVIGAGGTIGLQVIKFLLSESKYDITAFDLKNKRNLNIFKKYHNRINIVYGDLNSQEQIEFLLRNQDVVIHLSGLMPPLSTLNEKLNKKLNYDASVTLIESIKKINPKIHLLYASSSFIYGKHEENVSVKTKIKEENLDAFSKNLYKIETIIKKDLQNFTIFRLPLVLTDKPNKNMFYNLEKESKIEFITLEDAAYAFVSAVDNLSKINKKTYNVGGGEKCVCTYQEFLNKMYKYYGINIKIINDKLISSNLFYPNYFKDSYILNDILNFQTDTIDSYFSKLKNKNRKVCITMSKPFIKRGKNVKKNSKK